MKILNEKYLNKENIENSCLNGLTYETCNFSTIGMDSTYKNMIENIVWNTNIIDFNDSDIIVNNDNINTLNLYNAERANGIEPNPYIWTGLVALPYATDWGYASSESDCNTNLRASSNGYDYNNDIFNGGTCKNNNWIHFLVSDYSSMEFLSPASEIIGTSEKAYTIVVNGQGYIHSSLLGNASRIHPTIYLKSNIQIKDGDGSSGNPYKLK